MKLKAVDPVVPLDRNGVREVLEEAIEQNFEQVYVIGFKDKLVPHLCFVRCGGVGVGIKVRAIRRRHNRLRARSSWVFAPWKRWGNFKLSVLRDGRIGSFGLSGFRVVLSEVTTT